MGRHRGLHVCAAMKGRGALSCGDERKGMLVRARLQLHLQAPPKKATAATASCCPFDSRPYTRMVPRVSALTVAGTLKLVLSPLLPLLPGFGAAMVSFTRTPAIKFTLDFGPAMGGR